ncbi:MAG: Holliday junction resolvase RuvX [Alphaproteobacteria bacterium]|nr:Holliday junction resolvase RuvX [Alphaproteobacteria bacterium]
MTKDGDNPAAGPAADPGAEPTKRPSGVGETFEDAEAFADRLADGAALIGIDAGTKTLGLAISDLSRLIASPLETIRRTKFTKDIERLRAIVDENAITGLVLGLPRNLDGSEGPRAQSTRAMARNLNKIFALPILLWDERLTTSQAERMLIEADTSRKRRGEVIDKLAATLILQGALDRLRC